MAHAHLTKRKALILSFMLFIVGIAILAFAEYWWPGLLLAIGVPIAVQQYLMGRNYDVGVTLFVFLGAFITIQFNIPWQHYLLPVLFVTGGIYVFFREFFIEEEGFTEEEEEDEQLLEMEEEPEEDASGEEKD